MTRLLTALLALLLALGPVAPATGAEAEITTVRLRAGVRVEPAKPVTLADVAWVEGPQAPLIAPIVLAEPVSAGADPVLLSIDAVRDAIDKVEGVMHGRLTLVGTSCRVIARRPAAGRPAPVPPRAADPAAGRSSLRLRILEHLRALFNAQPNAIRAAFDPDDDELLDTNTIGMTLELRTLGGSSRIPIAIALYDGDRLVKSQTIRVAVQLRRDVAIATGAFNRGDTIGAESFTVENRWTDAARSPADPAELVGRVVRSRLKPGEVITADRIARPVHVERGDITSIRSVVGTAVVRTKARARADGVEGEVIEFEALDGSNRFLARVIGPGRAVVAPETMAQGDAE